MFKARSLMLSCPLALLSTATLSAKHHCLIGNLEKTCLWGTSYSGPGHILCIIAASLAEEMTSPSLVPPHWVPFWSHNYPHYCPVLYVVMMGSKLWKTETSSKVSEHVCNASVHCVVPLVLNQAATFKFEDGVSSYIASSRATPNLEVANTQHGTCVWGRSWSMMHRRWWYIWSYILISMNVKMCPFFFDNSNHVCFFCFAFLCVTMTEL